MNRDVVEQRLPAKVPRCVRRVEEGVLDLICDFRDADARGRARDRVRSLYDGCPECGFRESLDVLRTLEALLTVPPHVVPGGLLGMADRLIDLVGLMKRHALSRAK
jgi:hypothetical protein